MSLVRARAVLTEREKPSDYKTCVHNYYSNQERKIGAFALFVCLFMLFCFPCGVQIHVVMSPGASVAATRFTKNQANCLLCKRC